MIRMTKSFEKATYIWEKLKVCVVLFLQLLEKTHILLLHVFKRLTSDVHFTQQSLLVLVREEKEKNS